MDEPNTESHCPSDAEPWDGNIHLDPLTVSRILESWDQFEDMENELPKTSETPIQTG